MLRVFVERKVRRQILRNSMIISVLAFIAILFLWNAEGVVSLVAHPLRMFVNNVHGGITALAMQLSGGAVDSFTLSSVGSYRIEFQGGADALTFSAGYLGSALLGAVMFFLVNRAPHLVRGLAVITGLFTSAFTLLFIRPNETGDVIPIFICIVFGLALILMGWKAHGDTNQLKSSRTALHIVMNIASMMIALHVLLDLNHLLTAPARTGNIITGFTITNLVAAFSESVMPGLSVAVIAITWSAIAIVLLGIAINYSLIKPLKQIPKNDDIV